LAQNISLYRLICFNNKLTQLDVTDNPSLYQLFTRGNQLISLLIQNPNPTIDVLNIESQEPFDFVQIYKINGILVKEGKSTNINVFELSAGLYFDRVGCKNNVNTKSLLSFKLGKSRLFNTCYADL